MSKRAYKWTFPNPPIENKKESVGTQSESGSIDEQVQVFLKFF
jgi:hypothetical protein